MESKKFILLECNVVKLHLHQVFFSLYFSGQLSDELLEEKARLIEKKFSAR